MEFGFGHLGRSAAVINHLRANSVVVYERLLVDAAAHKRALALGLQNEFDGAECPEDILIVDALELSSRHIDWVKSFKTVISLSPVCNFFENVTHIFVKHLPVESTRSCSSAIINQDLAYGFVSCSTLVPRDVMDFSCIDLGLCLGGGSDHLQYDELVLAALENENVRSVTVIGDSPLLASKSKGQNRLSVFPKGERVWEILSGINLFIGGDGIMLTESIYQLIPTYSLRHADAASKNFALEELGALESISYNEKLARNTAARVTSSKRLEAKHSLLKNLRAKFQSVKLPEDIFKMITKLDNSGEA